MLEPKPTKQECIEAVKWFLSIFKDEPPQWYMDNCIPVIRYKKEQWGGKYDIVYTFSYCRQIANQ